MTKESILVVDDEKTIRAVVREALEDQGYGVCAVANTAGALQACEQAPYDLALIDLRLATPWTGSNSSKRFVDAGR